MNINPGKSEFTDAEHDTLRDDVRAIIEGVPGIAQAMVARQADVAPATLSQYLNGKYENEPGKTQTAAKLHKWLRARTAEEDLRRQLPLAPSFIPLHGSRAITTALAYARQTGRLVLITGAPGVSKTATARQFCEDYPLTWLTAMNPSTGGVPTMLLEVARAMGISDARGTPQSLVDMVVNKAREAKGLLIIDEAQHLSEPALETIRALNDRMRLIGASLGIVLMGNEMAYSRVGATGVKPAFAQVSSRFAQRRWINAADPRDAAALAHAWAEANREVITDREVTFCQQIAAKPGGLRNIEMTMEAALLAARGSQEPLGLDHLRGAFAQLSGVPAR